MNGTEDPGVTVAFIQFLDNYFARVGGDRIIWLRID